MNNMNNKLVKGLYIANIEAKWLYNENEKCGDYKVEQEHLDKMLCGKVDFSYELVCNEFLLENLEIKEYQGKLYTLDIMNVKYTNTYTNKDKKQSKTTKQLRDWTYINGFHFNGAKMTNWKRSGGKARMGECLFINDKLVAKSLDWARMGLDFSGDIDIASIRAYESLPLSSIIGTVEIDPKSILVIDDYDSVFDWEMSKTELIGKELVTKTGKVTEKNSIWDGQSLVDKSVFDKYETISDKGFMLLRNRFMKSAGFNTNISQFYMDYCYDNGLDYDTYTVKDIRNKDILVKDILLITSPNSIKIDKFADKVRDIDGYDYDNSWLDYWLDNAGTTYGVCEVEKASRFEKGKQNRLSYQMVNTIPFTREEVTELARHEVEYVESLKDDLDFFLSEVNVNDEELVLGEEEILIKGDTIDTTGAFIEMVKMNSDFANTKVFKDYRKNFISSKLRELRQGKIRVDGDYAVLLGNPIEMLYATTGEFVGEAMALEESNVHCTKFNDGEEIVGFRNPHICEGNIANLMNRENGLIKDYVNVTENIVVVNSIKYPLLTILQGADFDSDKMLLTNAEVIVKACKRVDHSVTPIPVSAIKNSGSNLQELTGANMSDVDHIIAKNYIGQDINLSQELNSLINHKKNNNDLTSKEMEELYDRVSKASSISQTEIDKAKRTFEDLNVPLELTKMTDGMNSVGNGDNRRTKPIFFKYIGDTNSKEQKGLTNREHRKLLDKQTEKDNAGLDDKEMAKKIKLNDKIQKEWEELEYVSMDTPMDWLQIEIDGIKEANRSATLQVIQLVKRNTNSAKEDVAKEIVKSINGTDMRIKALRADRELEYSIRRDSIKREKAIMVSKLKKTKLSKATMYQVMQECFNSVKKNGRLDKSSGIESLALELLFKAYGKGLICMFKQTK